VLTKPRRIIVLDLFHYVLISGIRVCHYVKIIPSKGNEMNETMTEFSRLREQSRMPLDSALADELGYSLRTLYRWESGEAKPRPAAIHNLESIIQGRQIPKADPKFRFIDLFAGIGGLRRGFEPQGGECVFTSEWNKYAAQTYRTNYPNDGHDIYGDITTMDACNIPEHDLLVAGFPCQPFSIAGVSKKNSLGREHGFRCDAQGTLFFDVARIIEYHRPRAFLLENVKNLVSHDKGNTFEVILRTLTDELGYRVQTRVIDAKAFVPQHRERIFIVGFRDNNDFAFDDLIIPDSITGPRIGAILHPEDGTEQADGHFTDKTSGDVSSKYTLSDKLWSYLQGYAAKHKAKGNGFGFGLVDRHDVARTLSARYYKDGSEILVNQGSDKNPRRLTPRECSRLMGFDSLNGSDFAIPVSDTQAYKQFGNAVAVPVVEAVAKHMGPWLAGTTPAEQEAVQHIA
jgi:DNA (cytosine-5)-methyltransferase 1